MLKILTLIWVLPDASFDDCHSASSVISAGFEWDLFVVLYGNVSRLYICSHLERSHMPAASENAASTLSFRTQILDRSEFLGQRRHDHRIGRQPGYVDQSRSAKNTILFVLPGYGPDSEKQKLTRIVDADEKVMDARRTNNTRARKMWRMAMLTFSQSAQKVLGELHPDAEALAVMQDFADRHKVRLLSVVAHRDESAIHYHSLFENITESERALRLVAFDLSAEQDFAGMHFAHLGITRGVAKAKRIADGQPTHKTIHRSVRQLHNDLPAELSAKQAELVVAKDILSGLQQKTALYAERQKGIDVVAAKIQTQVVDLVNYHEQLKREAQQLKSQKSKIESEELRLVELAAQLELRRNELAVSEQRLMREAQRLGVLAAEPDNTLRP